MKNKLEQLKEYLAAICGANNCALWLSGGKDSQLLLQILLAEKLKFSVVRFDDGWSREQKEIVNELIKKHSLQVFSYLPQAATLFGNSAGDLTFACAYAVSPNASFTVLRDIVPGERCSLDIKIKTSEKASPPVYFKTHILGSKKGEKHYAFDGRDVVPEKAWLVGQAKFVCPLYEWTDAEVLEALQTFGIDYVEPPEELNTGNVSCCTLCLQGKERVFCPKEEKEIYSIPWSPTKKLKDWQDSIK